MVRKFIRLGGIDVASPLPALVVTDMDRAFAGIPGIQLLIDPSYKIGTGLRNLAKPNDAMTMVSEPGPLEGAFANGAPAIQAIDGNTSAFVSAAVDINPEEWTIIAAHNLTARSSSNSHSIIASAGSSDPASPTLRVGFNGPGTAISAWIGGLDSPGSPTVTAAVATLVGRPAVTMWSYSGGVLRIFENGVEKAAAAFPQVSHNYLAGQWAMLRYARGLIGNVALLSSDLSKPTMAKYRENAISYLMVKYGV